MDEYIVSISKEELNRLPVETFNGEIHVVDTAEAAEIAAEILEKAPIIGFDTETKPTFQKGQVNQVALIQLFDGEKCFLVRLCKIGLPSRLKKLLENESIPKVGLSLKDDFHNLSRIEPISPKGFTDLQNYVKQFHITDCSLTKIHGIVMGRRISKSQQLTNWEASSLTTKQQQYAAIDAMACVNIYRKLSEGGFTPDASPYYHKRCQEEN